MGLKSKIGIFVLGCTVIGTALFWFIQKEPYSTEAIMDDVWDKYEVQSTMIGDTDPVLEVSVFDEKDIKKVEGYLENNLSSQDLEHYKLNVFQWSSDDSEYKENAQRYLE